MQNILEHFETSYYVKSYQNATYISKRNCTRYMVDIFGIKNRVTILCKNVFSHTILHCYIVIYYLSLMGSVWTPKKPPFTPVVTAFLTGHGPFRKYLQKFHFSSSSACECGYLASASEYQYSCPLTLRCHSRRPLSVPVNWLSDILSRTELIKTNSQLSNGPI